MRLSEFVKLIILAGRSHEALTSQSSVLLSALNYDRGRTLSEYVMKTESEWELIKEAELVHAVMNRGFGIQSLMHEDSWMGNQLRMLGLNKEVPLAYSISFIC